MNILAHNLETRPSMDPVSKPYTGPGDSEEPGILQRYLRIALRRRWAILSAIIACITAGLLATLLMTPKYTASVKIEISREADQVTNFQGVERDVSIADQEFYQTQYGLLRSRSLAERVATELRLADSPEFFELFGFDDGGSRAFEISNGRYPAGGRPTRIKVAGDILLDNVSIDPARLSRLVDISFTSPEPELAANVANAWAKSFIESQLERKVQSTAYGREVLQRQLAEYKDRLDESQRQLVAYASQEQIINLPAQAGGNGTTTQERSIVADDLAALNAALSRATADRIEAQARFDQRGATGSSAQALANPAINNLRQKRAELAADYAQLMLRFEPGYPAAQAIQRQIVELDRSITREEARVSGSIQAEYRQAVNRESALRARVDGLKSDYLDLRRRSIQYNIFQQEVDTNRALYDGLLQRFKEIGVAGGVGVNNVAIVDPADVPEVPSSPRLILNLLLAIIAGVALGIAIALGLEQLDETVADPEMLRRQLGIAVLGSVPRSKVGTPREELLDRKSDLFDAYLAIQTNLSFTTEHGVPRSLAVTSTRPAEGKSTTALALATTLARVGKKVILVDGDMRSPSVHQLVGVNHDHGLSNFLAGEDDLANLIFEIDDLGISAITAGPIPPSAAELLTGNRLSLLIKRLLEQFDHVIIDSPPVLGLADAPLLATRVEGIVYVVESHGIRLTQVKTALNRLASVNAHVFGGVLAKLDVQKGGHGYEYGYSYGREAHASES